MEPVHIIDKIGCSNYPLTINLAPAALGPAGIRHADVQIVRRKLLPVMGSNNMSQGMIVVVYDHFGHARCAGCKIKKHRIISSGRRRNVTESFCFFIGYGCNQRM